MLAHHTKRQSGKNDVHDRKKRKHQNKESKKEKNYKSKKRNQEPESSNQKFKLGQINSTIITTKRLTVGVKGIFGNAKKSSSVYRDLQDRIENRKLSKAVASEIELSLSKIIPSRNRDRQDGSSSGNSACNAHCRNSKTFLTPGKTSTPLSVIRNSARSHSVGSIIAKSVSSSVSTETPLKATPLPLETPYVKIAESIRGDLPYLKVFDGWDHLRDCKDELKKLHQNICPLTIVPKFRKEDFAALADDETLAKKSLAVNSQEDTSETFSSQKTTVSLDVRKTSVIKEREMKTQDGASSVEERYQCISSCDKKSPHALASSAIPENMFKFVPTDKKPDANIAQEQAFPSHHLQSFDPNDFGRNHVLFSAATDQCDGGFVPGKGLHPSLTRKELPNIFSQPKVQDILRQPIKMLRRNRRVSSQPFEIPIIDDRKSDFLDYIDSIPIQALENELLGRRKNVLCSRREIDDANSVPFELKKPTLESPSPPKLYRMNMF